MIEKWKKIANKYKQDREISSNAFIVLDHVIEYLVKELGPFNYCLDFGAGSGTHSRMISEHCDKIDAYEPNLPMFKLLEDQTPNMSYNTIRLLQERPESSAQYDLLLSSKVIDHIEDYAATLQWKFDAVQSGGMMILVIPHPIKYSGKWEFGEDKKPLYYKIKDYFAEVEIFRNRYDMNGDVIVSNTRAYHRIISTYFNALIDVGFEVKRIIEPTPRNGLSESLFLPIEKNSRIPNCMIFVCHKA